MPKELKAVIIAATVFLFLTGLVAYFAYSTGKQVEEESTLISTLKDEIEALKKVANKRKDLEKALNGLDETFREFVVILPAADLFTDEDIVRAIDE